MAFPDVVASELLAHEALQEEIADRLDRGVGQKDLEHPSAPFHIELEGDQDRGVRRARDGGEAGIGLDPVDDELHRRERVEGKLRVAEHDLDHALDEAHLDCREGPSVETADGAAALAAQEQVQGGIGKARLDRHEPGIVPSLGTEHRKLDRQRDRVEIIAEAHRRDAVERDLDVVLKEVAQARRQKPDHPVEDDLEHRQALVGHDAGIDDRPDAAGAGRGELVQREADELIDLPLRQDAIGARQVVRVAGPPRSWWPTRPPCRSRRSRRPARRAPRPTRRQAKPRRRRGLDRARALLGERCRPIAVEGLVFRLRHGFVLLEDDVLEEHRVDLGRVDGHVDAAQQLLAQTVDAGGAVEVARPELAYEDLETILDPRQQRLDLRYELLVLDLERGAELQDLGAILVRLVRKIDSHLADVEERHGRRVLWRFAGLASAVGEEPVAASAQGGERREADAAEDRELPQATGLDLLAVFGRSRLFGLFRLLRFLGHAAAHTLARERRRARPAAIPTLASYG